MKYNGIRTKNTFFNKTSFLQFCLFLVIVCPSTFCLDPKKSPLDYSYSSWTIRDGLPEDSVHTIAQTKDGYMWFGTEDGLIRFDGFTFQTFNRDNTPNLASNYILALLADDDGSLWIGTRSGGVVRYVKGKFSAIKYSGKLIKNNVYSLTKTQDGCLWIGTLEGELYKYKDNRIYEQNIEREDSSDAIYSIVEDMNSNLWMGSRKGLIYQDRKGKISKYTVKDGLASDIVLKVCITKKNDILIGTLNGLSHFKNKKFRNYYEKNGLCSSRILSVVEDKDGLIWIGTYRGLNIINKDNIYSIIHKEGLKNVIIRSIYEDVEGNIWVGTYGAGLYCIRDSRFRNYSINDGLPHEIAMAVYEDSKRNIWIGTYGGGLGILNKGRIKALSTKDGLVSDFIYAFLEDKTGSVWIGSFNGITRYKNNRIRSYPIPDNFVMSFAEDQKSVLWIGTHKGLIKFQNGTMTRYTKKDGLPSEFIYSILVNEDGSLWLSTDAGGISLFKDGKFKSYEEKDGLISNNTYCIYKDMDDKEILWIGTTDGLSRFKRNQFTNYTVKDGLFNNIIYTILDDSNGTLWMSCNKGIFGVKKKDLNDFADGKINSIVSISFNDSDGMISSECMGGAQQAGCRTSDGRLIFPTMKGITVMDPSKMQKEVKRLRILIENLIVDEKEIRLSDDVVIPAGNKNLEFHYTGITFSGADRLNFYYKLEGFDDHWIKAGNRRVAYYTNLPYGRYKFNVIARDSDGNWHRKGASQAFYLKPHFYQTVWFYSIIIISLTLFAAGTIFIRLRQLEARKKELSELVELRTQEIKEVNKKLEIANKTLEELANLDGLTGISNYRYFKNILYKEWKRAVRDSTILSLIMIDIDFFKIYNDELGHQAGDECLKKIARALEKFLLRSNDLVARYGGEEFSVILPSTDLEGAIVVAERLRHTVESLKLKHPLSSVSNYISISIGVASAKPSINIKYKSLIDAADKALYKAKKSGRNRTEADTQVLES